MDGEFKIAGEGKTVAYGTKDERHNMFNMAYTQSTALETVQSLSEGMMKLKDLNIYSDDKDWFNNACAFTISFMNAMEMYVTLSTAVLKARFIGDDEATVLRIIESQLSDNPELCNIILTLSDVCGDGEISAIIRDYFRRHPAEKKKDETNDRFEEMLKALLGTMRKE